MGKVHSGKISFIGLHQDRLSLSSIPPPGLADTGVQGQVEQMEEMEEEEEGGASRRILQ